MSLDEYIRQQVDAWPPLRTDQRDRLVILLTGGAA